jgi:hypothetical protein
MSREINWALKIHRDAMKKRKLERQAELDRYNSMCGPVTITKAPAKS